MSFSGTKGYLTKPKPGVMLNPLHPLSKGLVGYWLFNEGSGSKAYDISGKGNHGLLKNMLPNVQGSGWSGSKLGGGLSFDGTNDYVNVDPISIADNTPWSVGMRVLSNDSTKAMFYGNQLTAGNYTRFVYVDGLSQYRLYNDSNSSINWPIPCETNVFQNIVLTCDGTANANVDLYIDGINKGTKIMPDSSQTIKTIGSAGTVSYIHDGSIDFFYRYNRMLLPAEVRQLHYDPFCNLLQIPIRRYSVITPVGAIMNQFQRANIGADLYNGAIIA